jgi:FkbM family methyltransferase
MLCRASRQRVGLADHCVWLVTNSDPATKRNTRSRVWTLVKKAGQRVLSQPALSRLTTTAVRPFAGRFTDETLARIPVVRRFTVKVPGMNRSFSMVTQHDDMAVLVYWRGADCFDPLVARLLVDLAPGSTTFLDVGANVGLIALLVATASPTTMVYAFEPVPHTFARLQRNVILNASPTNLLPSQLALSHSTGVAQIHVPSAFAEDASLLSQYRPGAQAITVQTAALDSIVDQLHIDRVDLLKIDTEGTDHWVLQGALATLVRDRPFVICEVLSNVTSEPHIGPLLFDIGYKAFHLKKSGPEACTTVRGDPAYQDLNFLFVHPDRHGDLPEWFLSALS